MPTPSQTTADSGLAQDTVKTVFDLAVMAAYRAMNIFRKAADVRWDESSAPMRGNPVTFTIGTPLAVATTPLSETTEPTPVTPGDTTKSITLAEYGNAVKRTKKAKLTSFVNLDTYDAQEVAANMEESVDVVARDVLVAGTNVLYAGAATSRVTVAAASTFSVNLGRRAAAFLKGNNTPPPAGSDMYVGIIHPDVAYDIQVESGGNGWREPHIYSDPGAIYSGEIGAIGGVRYVENANAKIFTNAGVGSTVEVYVSLFLGAQALGEAVGEAQHVVISGPFDDLQRFVSIGWYGLLGFGRIRENSLVRVESSSSLATNV